MGLYNNHIVVDLDIIRENFRAIRKAAGVPAMAIVKANAYGHGAVEVATALADQADFFGVACIFEALELRHAGIKNPILVLGQMPSDAYPEAIRQGIRPTIFTYEDAQALSEAAQALDMNALFHFAVDTGMGRIGFQVTEQDADVCQKIMQLPNLDCEGIFSHYATSDEADLTRARSQAQLFEEFCAMLAGRGVHPRMRHMDNSAGIINFENHYDMVRVGIILYGLEPSSDVDIRPLGIKPALSWRSRIAHIKTLEAGRGVSYGATYTTCAPTRIATLPVGYADGYRRGLSGKFHVLIRGQEAPILGRICMDQMMVDVTHIPEVSTDDEVILLGDGLSAEAMAQILQTINYEIICGLSRRVPRVYLRDGHSISTVNYLLGK